jgi:hypothetical protein
MKYDREKRTKTKMGDKRREQYPGPRNPRFGCHLSQKGKGGTAKTIIWGRG